jgi:hypothetical protein
MKNKNSIIVLFAVLILIAGIVLFLVINKKTAQVAVEQTPSEDKVTEIKPEDIGLTLTASADNHKLILGVAKTAGITKLDYELDYTKKGDIPIGVFGHPQISSGQAVRQEIVLGTCSDVCHYDEDVTNIKLTLKVTKTDGTVDQVEKALELSQ